VYGVAGAQAVFTLVPKLPKEKPFVAESSNAPATAKQVNVSFFMGRYTPQNEFKINSAISLTVRLVSAMSQHSVQHGVAGCQVNGGTKWSLDNSTKSNLIKLNCFNVRIYCGCGKFKICSLGIASSLC
jgi:hypothetical protein